MIRVVIPRDKWVRGGRDAEFGIPALLNSRGNKCCLGHMGTACGVADEHMLHEAFPANTEAFDKWPPGLRQRALANINDARDIPDDIREAWVAEGFRRVGCEAVFVDTLDED